MERLTRRYGAKRVVSMLSDEERETLVHLWRAWARPEQIAPPGGWRVWANVAGRGAGKTRTLNEWLRERVERGQARRIALVAKTPADVRDVLVEGESGILAVSPPSNRPVYEPSKRRLTWPNGALALAFTSYEPDQLRGPQFDTAVCDEVACLVAETMVETSTGPRPITAVSPGDFVQTRAGLRRVTASWQSHPAAPVFQLFLSNGVRITGTGNHRFWVVDKGFVPLALLQYGDTMLAWDKQGRVSFGVPADGGSMAVTTATVEGSYFIAPSIGLPTAQLQMGWMFTTKMATLPIMPSATWRPLVGLSTCDDIALAGGGLKTDRPRVTARGSNGSSVNRMRSPAMPAVSCSVQRVRGRGFARLNALLPCGGGFTADRAELAGAPESLVCVPEVQGNASCAGRDLGPTIPELRRAACRAAMPYVVSVGPISEQRAVYDLTVDGGEFFANGILVHNSWKYPRDTWDNLQLTMRLGDPKIAIATTPRPISVLKEIMESPHTVVTRGTTYSNRANLAPAFLEQIITRYEGTRLGAQELMGELLEDMPGALWKRSMFEPRRQPPRKVKDGNDLGPDLIRVVVGVDPAVTSGPDSDETGIVVAGKGSDGRGYVLDDRSLRASPDAWAKRAVAAYHEYKADRIIAESNNGGEMVRLTLRTVDPNVPVTLVQASRGKRARAEPIAALYEQGKVSHTRMFRDLEDQLCTFVPGESDDSPDRHDALVWALSAIMYGYSGDPLKQVMFA